MSELSEERRGRGPGLAPPQALVPQLHWFNGVNVTWLGPAPLAARITAGYKRDPLSESELVTCCPALAVIHLISGGSGAALIMPQLPCCL